MDIPNVIKVDWPRITESEDPSVTNMFQTKLLIWNRYSLKMIVSTRRNTLKIDKTDPDKTLKNWIDGMANVVPAKIDPMNK